MWLLILPIACQSHDGIGKGALREHSLQVQSANLNSSAADGKLQEAGNSVLVAELGSFSLEFTRLSQLSNDPRYFDAIQRITDEFDRQQETTKLPGMFPVVVNAKDLDLGNDSSYTLSTMADSFYKYLPKVNQIDVPHRPRPLGTNES